jgi:hypothetical protein
MHRLAWEGAMKAKQEPNTQKVKGKDQKGLGERYGKKATAPALHPAEKESGTQGASNVSEDETSGSE